MYRSILLTVSFIFAFISSQAQYKIAWDGMGMNIAANSFGNMHPRVSMDRKGNAYVIWSRMSDNALMFAKWNGTTFDAPIKLNPAWLKVATASWMGPQIASKGDTIYIVAKRTPEGSDTNHIYIFSSYNGGSSFSTPAKVDNIADSLSRFPTVTVDAMGNPLVAFMKFNSSFLESRWVVSKSTDYGRTFLGDVKASGYSGATSEVCDCCPGSIVSSGNVSTMVYRDNLSNRRDIWAGTSKNNASSFSTGLAVDNTNWMINSCPASGPDAVIIGDSLYTVFLSGGKGTYRTYLSSTSISSGKLTRVRNLAATVAGLTQQNYPRIAADGKAMAIVWKQTVNGVAQLPLLFTNNMGKGIPSVYDTVDMADVTNTDVALGNGNIFVVWEDDKSGTIKFRKGTYTPAANVKELKEANFKIYPNPATSLIMLQSEFALTNSQIKIVNLIGEIVLSSVIVNDSNPTIDVSLLKEGVYFIQVKTNDKILTQKFNKQ